MKKKSKFKNATVLVSALLILAGLFYGCYSKGVRAEKTDSYGKAVKQEPLSEETIAKFMDSVRKVDGEAEAHYKLALYFQEKWRHKLAIDELKQVLMRNPVHAKAYNALGVSWDNLGDHEAAIDYYKLALNIDSKLDFAYNNLGYSYLLKGDNQKAEEAFKQAITLNGKEKRYRNNLGLVYVKQNKYELAYEQFRVLDSEGNAKSTLAKVMSDLGRGSETEKVMLALRTEPKIGLSAGAAEAVEAEEKLPDLSGEKSDSASEPGFKEKIEEAFAGPVIDLPPVAEQEAQEIKMASSSAVVGPKETVQKKEKLAEYYHVSSVILSQDTPPKSELKQDGKVEEVFQRKPITNKPADIKPPKFEITSRMKQEESEERILIASSSTQAGGWQNAPQPKDTVEKSIVAIEVQNGNGVKHSAKKVAEHLRKNGFNISKIDDAQSHDHFSTKVFYCNGNLKEVLRMLKTMPEISKEAELWEIEGAAKDIRLLVGKDLIQKNHALFWGNPNKLQAKIVN